MVEGVIDIPIYTIHLRIISPFPDFTVFYDIILTFHIFLILYNTSST